MTSIFGKTGSSAATIKSADTNNDNMSQDRSKDASTTNKSSTPNRAPKRIRKVPLDRGPTRQPTRERPILPLPLHDRESFVSAPPTTFDRFTDLPAELRVRIWKCALQGPRSIKITFSRQILNYFPPKRPSFRRGYKIKPAQLTYRFKCTGENPGTLLACSESRYYSLKRLPNALRLYTDGQLIRFDGSIDTIFVDNTSLSVHANLLSEGYGRYLQGSENVRYVAVQNPEVFSFGLVNLLVSHFHGVKAVHTGFTGNERVDTVEHIKTTLTGAFRYQFHEKFSGKFTVDQESLLSREVSNMEIDVGWSHLQCQWPRRRRITTHEPIVIENDLDAWEELIAVLGGGSKTEDVTASA